MTGLKVAGISVHVQDVKIQGQEDREKEETISNEEKK